MAACSLSALEVDERPDEAEGHVVATNSVHQPLVVEHVQAGGPNGAAQLLGQRLSGLQVEVRHHHLFHPRMGGQCSYRLVAHVAGPAQDDEPHAFAPFQAAQPPWLDAPLLTTGE